VITIVNYDHTTFIVQATGVIFENNYNEFSMGWSAVKSFGITLKHDTRLKQLGLKRALASLAKENKSFVPLTAGFLADKIGKFRILLSVLTALGGFFALLLLLIPPSRDVSAYPDQLRWGVSCGRPGNRARFQKLMLHGFNRDNCELRNVDVENATFSPGTCGYLCPTKSAVKVKPYFVEYKVIW